MQLLTGPIAIGCAWCLTIVPRGSLAFWTYLVLSLIALAALLCSTALALMDFMDEEDGPAKRAAQTAVLRLIDRHLDTLARRRISLVTIDHYGIPDTKAWDRELRSFIKKVIAPALSETDLRLVAPDGDLGSALAGLIDKRVSARSEKLETQMEFDPDMTSAEFEQWCAARLAKLGWRARTVGGSGDQGADVLAERGGRRVVIQCKLYQSPVGNKAVQEAFAAMTHYSADLAAVITSSEFTPSARRLSATTGVVLVLHSEIDRFDELLVERGLVKKEPVLIGGWAGGGF
jgi:restriction system protein